MALDADTLLDRMQLKQQLLRWRSFAILLLTALALLLVHRSINVTEISEPDSIARIDIEGVITTDRPMQDLLDRIREDDKIKALIVYLDTPGGTAIGGEELYLGLRRIRDVKPVVILMRTVCASAGYMTALGGSHLMAREGTLTGSIGVIMQTIEVTELAESLGIKPVIIRSGDNKAVPNPLAELEPEQRQMVENVVESFFTFFIEIVKTERNFNDTEMARINDGRVFTGRQALDIGLIDELGGEREALNWLETEHDISAETNIKTLKPKREQGSLFERLNRMTVNALEKAEKLPLALDGLLMIWQPTGFDATHQ